MLLRRLRHGGFLLALFLMDGLAWAGSFSVSPVRLTLTAAQPIAALAVSNAGDEPAMVQLEATNWSQRDGVDGYEATRELIATPPIFTVPAHGTQVIRVGLRRGADPRRELTYRLYLQEVLPPPPPGFVGMRVALRLGVPVFVSPAVAGAQALQWQLSRGAGGALSVTCLNSGTVHSRIASFSLSSGAGGAPLMTQDVAADLHAGQQRAWVLSTPLSPPPGTALRLTALTERGDVHADLIAP